MVGMPSANSSLTGRISAIWRYPVKTMIGEEIGSSELGERGLVGDRGYALVDVETGKVVSAKNPRRWPTMFEFRAAYVEPPRDGQSLPAVRITLPDGDWLTTDQKDVEARLSTAL